MYKRQVLNYTRSFEGNFEADVAPGENEFDTPGLGERQSWRGGQTLDSKGPVNHVRKFRLKSEGKY